MTNNFADNLKKIRKDNNLSQEQLAEKLGVSRQAISKWESASAYPEMDKIIFLCEKFNLNIDDLLHKDIKEVKGEEESKKNLNKYVSDFLKFLTDTINLFSNMNFKSKMKCIFEEIIIILLLIIISVIGFNFIDFLFDSIFSFIPDKYYYYVNGIIDSIIIVFFVISSIIVFLHIFKTRYLDYYSKLKKEINNENTNSDIKEELALKKDDGDSDNHKKKRILFRKNENKIIIRDPKHSEYRFITGLSKFIVGIIKILALCFGLFLSLLLIGILAGFIISFMVYKTGMFFIGLLGAFLSIGVIDVIFILLLINFIFNRQNDKKKMVWSFILSLIIFGVSCGLIFIGTLSFDVVEPDETQLKTEAIELEMADDLFYRSHYDLEDAEYIETDINNVKIEYSINKLCQGKVFNQPGDGIHIWRNCSNTPKLVREVIKNINDKKIIELNSDIVNVKIYASKENIAKLVANKNTFEANWQNQEEMKNFYQKQLQEQEEIISSYQNKIYEYESNINDLKIEIEEYKNEILWYQNNE